jgi:hypothetical protein
MWKWILGWAFLALVLIVLNHAAHMWDDDNDLPWDDNDLDSI